MTITKYDRKLTKHFIYGVDDKGMISEMFRDVSAYKDINDTSSEWLLLLAQNVESQRAQMEALDNTREARDFD